MSGFFPLFVGLRYTRASNRSGFVSFVSVIALLGLVLGVSALIIVLSVMNGFERELRDRILGVVPHATVRSAERGLENWKILQKRVGDVPGVVSASPYSAAEVMLSYAGRVNGARVSGILPSQETSPVALRSGDRAPVMDVLQSGEYNIVLGALLARQLGVIEGDQVNVILPRVNVTPVGVFPRMRSFTVANVFSVGAQVDASEALIHLDDAVRLFRAGNGPQGLRIRVSDPLAIDHTVALIKAQVGPSDEVQGWRDAQGSLFDAIKMEKRMISLLLMIIVAVAAFNIVSIMTMTVAEKRSDIAVLRTMGASRMQILFIFIIRGTLVGVLGVFCGVLLGVPLAVRAGEVLQSLENLFGFRIFDPQVYFISYLPSVLQWSDVWSIVVSAMLLSLLATMYPAWKASRIGPAELLRYG